MGAVKGFDSKYALQWLGERANLEPGVYDKGTWRPRKAEERSFKKKRRNFSPIPCEVVELQMLPKMKESDLKVYFAQWVHTSPYSDVSLAGRKKIAFETGYSIEEVSRARTRLVKLGLMDRLTKQVYKNNSGQITGYQPAFRMKAGEEIMNEVVDRLPRNLSSSSKQLKELKEKNKERRNTKDPIVHRHSK